MARWVFKPKTAVIHSHFLDTSITSPNAALGKTPPFVSMVLLLISWLCSPLAPLCLLLGSLLHPKTLL